MHETHAKRYVEAFFDYAIQHNFFEKAHQDLSAISQLADASREFTQFLNNHTLSPEIQISIVDKTLHEVISGDTMRLVHFLIAKKRLFLLKAISGQFERKYLEHKKILKVYFVSRKELDKAQVSSLAHYLKLRFRKDVQPHCSIDPLMLGGVKVKVGDLVYDYSVRKQLYKFKEKIIHS